MYGLLETLQRIDRTVKGTNTGAWRPRPQ